MPSAIKGVLIECDPSIRALVLNIDAKTHDIIIEELDETHLMVDENKVEYIKSELNKLLAKNTFVPEGEE
ncbi:similar to Saccharomyces cerevisiae YDR079C-A TFB5 Component of the RNA polymerase II general transcription and DNA repair factor TFIIH [Geotrichum candidum]|uniref:General transcription and DNA repair factor IIH subunit TFB5 n=1 Tax=Geotrichum candidum TaxID=1173061 RepID=A0A0J9X4I1_GEOCN|nr:similar to Saccharomyces cerevisiae YDR079C-A TFB5 Component of the RNA polymerase II general transcription and DNA repair factor TFIIH [Geotrichum candidum]